MEQSKSKRIMVLRRPDSNYCVNAANLSSLTATYRNWISRGWEKFLRAGRLSHQAGTLRAEAFIARCARLKGLLQNPDWVAATLTVAFVTLSSLGVLAADFCDFLPASPV